MSDTSWIECSDRLPPVGAKVEAMDRDGETEAVTVRRDHTGLWADPGYSCVTRYFDKNDHLPRWRLVEPQPDVPATKYPAIAAMLDLEIDYLHGRLEAAVTQRAAMNEPMTRGALLGAADRGFMELTRREVARGAYGDEVESKVRKAAIIERNAISALPRGGR